MNWLLVRSLRCYPPNPTPVTLLAIYLILNAITYQQFSSWEAQLHAYTAVLAGSFTCIVTWLRLKRRSWRSVKALLRFNWVDAIVAVTIFIILVVWAFLDARYANWVGQITLVIIFIPFIKKAWCSQASMSVRPWVVGMISFCLQGLVTLGGEWESMVYPLVGIVCYHSILGVLFSRPLRFEMDGCSLFRLSEADRVSMGDVLATEVERGLERFAGHSFFVPCPNPDCQLRESAEVIPFGPYVRIFHACGYEYRCHARLSGSLSEII
ncbi:MAG: hypothetical protein Q8Q20_04610 [bacterium]|nr:hypothetical protein [bacterium]